MTTTDVDFSSNFLTLRRFYLKKRVLAHQNGDLALSSVWWSKQEEQASAALPDDFPAKATLAAVGYTAVGDLEGADATELVEWTGITNRAAAAVLAAYAAL